MRGHDVTRQRRWGSVLSSMLAAAVLAGCASLPNMEPFTQTTVKLTSAVQSAGDASVEEVRRAADMVLPQNKDRLLAQATALEGAWAKHVAALEAASDYARSLQSVVDAANQAKQSVQNVTDAATDLANTVGLQLGPGVAIASDALKSAYTHIANARGRKTLTEAMDDLAPAIDQLTLVFDASLQDLDRIVNTSGQLQLNSLRSDHATELGYRSGLVQKRLALYQTGWNSLTEAQKLELKSVEEAIAAADSWHEPYVRDYNTIATRRDELRAAITAIRSGVKEWAVTHSRLRVALKEGGQIETSALIDTVVEIRDLVQRVRDL